VGGWNNYQINPAEFSKELCHNISENFMQYELFLKIREKRTKCNNNNTNEYSPDCDYYKDMYSEEIVKKLLIKSTNSTKSQGTSTCSILMLDKSPWKMYASYIGDSSFLILRFNIEKDRYEKWFKSEEMMHDFNTPFQVGKEGDDPEMAKTKSIDLKNNDLVILATDG
jgi:hypothetical protein